MLALARRVLPRLPQVRAVLFEAVPHSVAELGTAGLRAVPTDIHAAVDDASLSEPSSGDAPDRSPRDRVSTPTRPTTSAGETARREAELLDYTTRLSERLPGEDNGAEVLRHLSDQARLSLLLGTHRTQLAELLSGLGVAAARAVLHESLAVAPASAWPQEQAAAFDAWFGDFSSAGGLATPARSQQPASCSA